MSSLYKSILKETLEELKGTKNFPESIHLKLTDLFIKGQITKKSVISVLESDIGEE